MSRKSIPSPPSPAPLLLAALAAAALAFMAVSGPHPVSSGAVPLDSLAALDLVRVKGEVVDYRGRRAIHLVDEPHGGSGGRTLAILKGTDFANGTVTLDVAAAPVPGAPDDARGFIGLAFHVQQDPLRFECIYLRMTNGHADDPVRRSHVVQYISYPAFYFDRLRKESPGVYEKPGDVEPGVWTHVRIVVAGSQARFYLRDAARPALTVDGLKLGPVHGPLGLFVDADSDGYFTNLRVTPADR